MNHRRNTAADTWKCFKISLTSILEPNQSWVHWNSFSCPLNREFGLALSRVVLHVDMGSLPPHMILCCSNLSAPHEAQDEVQTPWHALQSPRSPHPRFLLEFKALLWPLFYSNLLESDTLHRLWPFGFKGFIWEKIGHNFRKILLSR